MSSEIERMYQLRLRAARYNRAGFMQPFSMTEIEAMEKWLIKQRAAEAPDQKSWTHLFTELYPFYRLRITLMLENQMVPAIIAGADPVEDVQDLSVWNDLEDGLRLVLENVDLSALGVFDSIQPVFIDPQNPDRAFWLEQKRENGYNGEWVMSRTPVGSDQVFHVLMRSWSGQTAKAWQARKICCDLLQACLEENKEQILGGARDEQLRAKILP